MDSELKGLIIIVGNYGSGKTEVAINLAVDRKKAGMAVRVADLDLVNPYFRTREARKVLARLDIDLVIPPAKYLQADLPMLMPQIAGMIRRPSEVTLLDVGGDDVGATVLASLAGALKGQTPRMLQVVNPFRPHTDTVAGCQKIRREIEAAARLQIDGLVGNANLIDETETQHVYDGYDFVASYAHESGLPLEFITVPSPLMGRVDMRRFKCPVLKIRRQLVPPWKRAACLNEEGEENAL